ncbi:MAG: hypothetical protein IPH79_09135 [Sphingomonadales bacterium]|nr:hypothetical protein [Sphingomonadales bacterium]
MKILNKRLSELELRAGSASGRWHRIIQHIGQSFDDALAHYQACNGPVAEGDSLIVRKVIAP